VASRDLPAHLIRHATPKSDILGFALTTSGRGRSGRREKPGRHERPGRCGRPGRYKRTLGTVKERQVLGGPGGVPRGVVNKK
jgi:hypothetical protein